MSDQTLIEGEGIGAKNFNITLPSPRGTNRVPISILGGGIHLTGGQKTLQDLIKTIALKVNDKPIYNLASGGKSRYYLNMKTICMDPKGINAIGENILDLISDKKVDYIGGLAVGAIPIITIVTSKSIERDNPIPGFFVREIIKDHGDERKIEGNLKKNSYVVMVDDVTTKGTSVYKAVDEVRNKYNCKVDIVITVVDRCDGATEFLAEKGIELMPLCKISDEKVDEWYPL